MSEYNFSIASSRRSSTTSKYTTTNIFNDSEFSISSAFKKSNWFEAYLYLKDNENIFSDNHQLLIDEILKLLFDDSLTKGKI